MNDVLYELYEDLLAADVMAKRTHLEQYEIARINILNKIIKIAEELGLKNLIYLANEAKRIGDAESVLQAIEEMSD